MEMWSARLKPGGGVLGGFGCCAEAPEFNCGVGGTGRGWMVGLGWGTGRGRGGWGAGISWRTGERV